MVRTVGLNNTAVNRRPRFEKGGLRETGFSDGWQHLRDVTGQRFDDAAIVSLYV